MRFLASLLAAAALAACDPVVPQLLRGRIDTRDFESGLLPERVTATAGEGLVARAVIDPEGGFLLALPAGARYRITLETGEARAYTMYNGDAFELDVRCAGPLHDLGQISARTRNCCDELAAEHQSCLIDCTAGGEEVAACWVSCRDAEDRVAACVPRRADPECDRIEGAVPEHPYDKTCVEESE
jgi:hypothetical protein